MKSVQVLVLILLVSQVVISPTSAALRPPDPQSKAQRDEALRLQAVEDQIASMVERIQELDDDRKSAESAANDAENRAALADGGSLSSDPRTAAAARSAAGSERQNAANLRARVRSDNDEILSLTRQIEELKYAESTDGAPPRPKPAASSSDPLVGVWKLNARKSTFAEEAPKQETREVEPAKGGIHAADTAVYKDGRTVRIEWTAKYDGKDYPFKGDAARTIAISRASDHFFNFKIKLNGRLISAGQIVCSPDGKSQTIAGTVTDARGTQPQFVTNWDRQP